MTRTELDAYLEANRSNILGCACLSGIPLDRVEFIAPFVESSPRLTVWFFFETDDPLRDGPANRWSQRLMKTFTSILRLHGYDESRLSPIQFSLDSHENVVREYEGRDIYRLR